MKGNNRPKREKKKPRVKKLRARVDRDGLVRIQPQPLEKVDDDQPDLETK